MSKTTASLAILTPLSTEYRRVFSDWRALILVRRETFELTPGERRWSLLPHDRADLYPLFRQMQQRGEIRPLRGLRHIYEVTVPYARQAPLEVTEALFEVHPYAALSHLSALVFHGLTNDLPQVLTASAPFGGLGEQVPLGTEPRDWDGLPMVRGRTPKQLLGQPVEWMEITPDRYFGTTIYQPHGYLIRATNLEKTLLDAIQAPDRAGGIENVLRAWVLAGETLDLDLLVQYVDRLNIALLRQRVGYILDELGLTHRVIEEWPSRSRRGGSSRLVGSAPFSPMFSERWNLSLNGPVTILRDATP